jgi:phage tail-like protein
MAASDPREPALALRFSVTIGSYTIERFTQVDGLTAEWEVEEFREGGQGGFVHRLPKGLKHTNVKMIRPIDADSAQIAAWFTRTSQRMARQDATVTAYDGNRREVARWELTGAWPLKYTGPSLMSTSVLAATETLEIAHTGFTVRVAS